MKNLESILYVDDDPDICVVVKMALGLVAGLHVSTANSGKQALEMAPKIKPDLILMDVMMPGLDGPSTLERIRRTPEIAAIPIIFMTAKVLPAEIARFFELGVIGVIGKPFDPTTLAGNVSGMWSKGIAATAAPAAPTRNFPLQRTVDSLANGFLERTKDDIGRMQEMIEGARRGDRSMFQQIQRVSHSIHGAGAMFGFPGISTGGGAIEHLVQTSNLGAPASSTLDERALVRQLMTLLGQLTRAVEAAEQTAPDPNAMLS